MKKIWKSDLNNPQILPTLTLNIFKTYLLQAILNLKTSNHVFQLMVKYLTGLFTNIQTLKFKSRLHNCVFRNHNYNHKQRTLKHRNTQNVSKSTNQKSDTMTF